MNASFAHLVSLESVVSITGGRSRCLLVGGQELAHANGIVGIQVALTITFSKCPSSFHFQNVLSSVPQEIGNIAACSPRHPGRRDGYSRHYPEIFRCWKYTDNLEWLSSSFKYWTTKIDDKQTNWCQQQPTWRTNICESILASVFLGLNPTLRENTEQLSEIQFF